MPFDQVRRPEPHGSSGASTSDPAGGPARRVRRRRQGRGQTVDDELDECVHLCDSFWMMASAHLSVQHTHRPRREKTGERVCDLDCWTYRRHFRVVIGASAQQLPWGKDASVSPLAQQITPQKDPVTGTTIRRFVPVSRVHPPRPTLRSCAVWTCPSLV